MEEVPTSTPTSSNIKSSNNDNGDFQYNMMLAKALSQLMPASERQIIRIWFERIAEIDTVTKENVEKRDEYIKFILLMMHNNQVLEYFKKLPPLDIAPLKDVISPKEYEDVVIMSDQGLAWLENFSPNDTDLNETINKRKVPPEKFLDAQPLPKDGIICYFGAFSDQTFK